MSNYPTYPPPTGPGWVPVFVQPDSLRSRFGEGLDALLIGLGALSVIGVCVYAALVQVFVGTCDRSAGAYDLTQIQAAHDHVLIVLCVVLAFWLVAMMALVAVPRQAMLRRAAICLLAGLLSAAPLLVLLATHPDLSAWHSHFCIGG